MIFHCMMDDHEMNTENFEIMAGQLILDDLMPKFLLQGLLKIPWW